MAFVFSQVPGVQTRMWIGLNDLQQERKFRWSDQSRVTYTYWNTRQPDNYRSNEDCVEILPYYNQKGKWNDNTCSGKQGYICQKGIDHVVISNNCCVLSRILRCFIRYDRAPPMKSLVLKSA